jgi:hypothetical protein
LDTGIETFPENVAIEKRELSPLRQQAAASTEILRRARPLSSFAIPQAERSESNNLTRWRALLYGSLSYPNGYVSFIVVAAL